MFDWLRRLLQWLTELIARLFGANPKPVPPPPTCPIGWQPSLFAPVFYGARDYLPNGSDGPPTPCRVFFPSIDGAVFDAPILEGCCRYPLIVFAHGNCAEPGGDHYQKWFQLPAVLARCGYVVVLPSLPLTAGGAYPWDNDAELRLLEDVISWMRNGWEHRAVLLPAPATGIAGHSYGALLASRLALEAPISAYVSLSGVWSEWPATPPNRVRELAMPKLFTWGSGIGDVQAQFDAGWSQLQRPRHKALFDDAGHWDYLSPGASVCEGARGSCPLVSPLAADLVSIFFSKYLAPECWPGLEQAVADTLLPPRLNLTQEQQFFAGGHLMSFSLLGPSRPGCKVTLSWATSNEPGGSGTVTRP